MNDELKAKVTLKDEQTDAKIQLTEEKIDINVNLGGDRLNAGLSSGQDKIGMDISSDGISLSADIKDGEGGSSGEECRVHDVVVNGRSVVRNKVANIDIPTKTSELTNDSGYITNNDIPSDIFIATYGVTTWQECKDALMAGKVIYCNATIDGYNLFLAGSKQKEVYGVIEFYCYAQMTNGKNLVRAAVTTSNIWSNTVDTPVTSSDLQNTINDKGIITDLDKGTTGMWFVNGTVAHSPYTENIFGSLIVGSGPYKPQLLCVSPTGSDDIKIWTRRYKTGTSSWTTWAEVPLMSQLPTLHIININATTSAGTYKCQCQINASSTTTFTTTGSIAAYLYAKKPNLRIMATGTYTTNGTVYQVESFEAISNLQIRIEMYKVYDGTSMTIDTGAVEVTDIII